MKKKQRQRVSSKAIEKEDARAFVPTLNHKAEEETEGWGRDGLTLRQRKFVKAYIGPAAGNGTKAAELAGYNSNNSECLKVTASRLLTYANVQRALSRAMARHKGGKAWTLRGLVEIASTTMADFITVDAQGVQRVDFAKAQNGAAIGAIKKLRLDPEGSIVGLELYDRKAALDSLAKIHGTLIDRLEHSGSVKQTVDLKNLTPDELLNLERILTSANRRAGIPDLAESRIGQG